jgi:predicted DCC family thiol-disulfide oxidoreductase YuxK
MRTEPNRPQVFYDGGCPLCRREIDHYRRLDRDERVEWVDILQAPESLARAGLDREEAMARFHVLDGRGRWQTGAWGFAEVWSHLPYYRRLAGAVRGLGLLPLMDAGYRLFARRRLAARCRDGACAAGGRP